jgi:phosphatidylserine/phosphatidylglycerophosphate/cardiolipin synthase-like enzyme
MKRLGAVFILGLLIGGVIVYLAVPQLTTIEGDIIGVYFSPVGQCEEQIIYWINQANESIYICVYSFTLDSVGDALVNAFHRNVTVKVVFDKSQVSKYSEYHTLQGVGIDVRNDTNSGLMHHKFMIVDEFTVLTGSYNWSKNAEENNNENLLVVQGKDIAIEYEMEFWRVWNW